MKNITGEQFGNWTVLNNYITSETGERKWLCHCVCGTERYVLERSLLYGSSKSCGCVRKENAAKVVAHDLAGKVFGDLTIVEKSSAKGKNGGILWKCICSCGKECDVLATLLVTGKRTNCGCKQEKQYYTQDIAGRKFEHLTALYPTMERRYGSVVWHCRCDCGNEIDVPYNSLVYCHMKSCGCQKREHETNLGRFLGHTNGTAVAMLKSTKTFSNNTTGYRGVYFVNGKYLAKIVFQKKQYHLGKYDTAEEAAEARKQAEEKLFLGFADYYEQWKTLADTDPDWASANPIQVLVNKTVSEVFLSITPELPLISGARENTKVGAKWEKAKTCQENISGT